MKHLLWKIHPSVCLGIGTVWAAAAIGLAESPASNKTAEGLLRQALRAEVDDQPELRDASLQEALRATPDFAPAHWHSGHVRGDGQWVTVPEAERRAAKSSALASYTQLRDSSPDSAAAHQRLATFCRKNGLVDRERWHWANLLRFDPGSREAIRALGLRRYRNAWLTEQEIEYVGQMTRQHEQARQRWQPVLKRLREALESPVTEQREAALAELRTIKEPDAIPFLVAEFPHPEEAIQLEIVGVLGKMPDPPATLALLRFATLGRSEKIADAAAAQLKLRPLFSYMPILVGSLQSPIEYSHKVFTGAGWSLGMVNPAVTLPAGLSILTLYQEGVIADYAYSSTFQAQPVDRGGVSVLVDVLGSAHLADLQAVEQVKQVNANAAALNSRLVRVLECVTGEELGSEPQTWWKWWMEYNELPRSESKPIVAGGVTWVFTYSCFAPGTPVWTEAGPTPIEKIRVGDRVLSQDPHSGEVAYKLVIGTTRGPPTPIMRLEAGGMEFGATRGHVFWRVGDGWRMAKELRAGDRLHGLFGAVVVDQLSDLGESPTHNLVVQDFATYFVGQPRLLSHDITARQVTTAVVPGLVDEKPVD
jgi:Pretoxin HINT domain